LKIKKILVSQPKPTNEKSPYFALAKKYKLDIDFRPFIQVEGINLKEYRNQKINILDYSSLVFTSRVAVDHFFNIAEELRISIPNTTKYFCLSESIAYYLQKYIVYRKRKIFYGNGKIEDLLPSFQKFKDDKYLIPVSDKHKLDIFKFMDTHKLSYEKIVLYKTISSDLSDLDINQYDVLLFFSPSGVKSLLKNFKDFKQGDKYIGAFGPATSKTVKDHNLRLDIKAPIPQAPSMTVALELFIKEVTKKEKLAKSK
jgi:uroporphyrinogen-III synthase